MPLNTATRKALALLAAAAVIAAAFLVFRPDDLAIVLLAGAVILGMGWTLNKLPQSFLAGLSLLVFLTLSQWIHVAYGLDVASLPGLVRSLLGPLFFFLPVFAVMLAAVLVFGVLRDVANPLAADKVGWFSLAVRSGLALLLIGVLATDIYWASLWDQTTDGTGGITTAGATSISAIAAGAILEMRLAGKRRWVGRLSTVLIPLVLFGAFLSGNGADYHALTAQRAARIQAALERFKTKNGFYPQELQELAPGELLAVPEPAIFPGEGWCYQTGPDFYQLSTYDRRYFSTPFSLHVFAAAGNPSGLDTACQDHLVELKRKYDPIAYPDP